MALGIEGFRQVALQGAERVAVGESGDVVGGSKGGLLDRFAGWITGSTARENRAAFESLRQAVQDEYGTHGGQAFRGVEQRAGQGKRLDSAQVRQVLDTASRLNALSGPRQAVLDSLPGLAAHSDELALAVVKLGLLGEGSVRLGEHPVEIWQAKQLSPETQALDFYQVSGQILQLDAQREVFLATLPEGQRELVASRLDQAVDIARTSAALQQDQFKADYAQGLTQHIMGIRDAGIVQRFPQGMQCRQGSEDGGRLRDENGRSFDHCRGKDSHVTRLDQYLRQQGLSQKVIARWGREQAGDSWSEGAQALKYTLARQRDVKLSKYWMGQGRTLPSDANRQQVERHFQRQVDSLCRRAGVSQQQFLGSVQAWHALNMEFLARVELPGNNRQAKTLKVYRTESDVVMKAPLANGLQPQGTLTLRRGPAESGSLIAPVTVFGSHVTTQSVPHHRVFAGYYFERSPGANNGTFLNNYEKEVLFMPHDIVSTYQGKTATEPFNSLF